MSGRISKTRLILRYQAAHLAALAVLAVPILAGCELQSTQDQIHAQMEFAKLSEKRGRVKVAREAYRKVLELRPGHPEARAGFDRTDAEFKRMEKALGQ